jgi:hypothetical protein
MTGRPAVFFTWISNCPGDQTTHERPPRIWAVFGEYALDPI